jgi:hypothetical protein
MVGPPRKDPTAMNARRILLLLVLAAVALGAAPPVHAADGTAQLAWLAGRWGGEQGGVRSEEHWTSPAGGALVGMHKDVRGGRAVAFEFFRIVEDSTGGVCYLSSPQGRPATVFCAVELTDRRVVFENKEHDFPQRVIYWRGEKNRLHARIEGILDGRVQAEEWAWARLR